MNLLSFNLINKSALGKLKITLVYVNQLNSQSSVQQLTK